MKAAGRNDRRFGGFQLLGARHQGDRRARVTLERGDETLLLDIARQVDLVYDFALPPLTIDALTTGDGVPLRRWIAMRPANSINVLDTHDGIGVIDIGADPDEHRFLSPRRRCVRRGSEGRLAGRGRAGARAGGP